MMINNAVQFLDTKTELDCNILFKTDLDGNKMNCLEAGKANKNESIKGQPYGEAGAKGF